MTQMTGGTRLWASTAAVLAVFLVVVATMAVTDDATRLALGTQTAVDEQQLNLTEFAIDPEVVIAAPGTTLQVVNDGSVPHDLTIEGGPATPELAAGESASLALGGLAAGTYRMFCGIAGHADAGMEGTLTVTADADVAEQDHGHATGAMSAAEMAAIHDGGVADFPAETDGVGNQPLTPEVDTDGVKVFELTASEITWETEPGEFKAAYAYNGTVPGPRIDVDLGDRVRVVLHNELEVPTAVHFHGLVVPNEMDGVPGLTQDSVLPGESFTYEFTVRNVGSHMYHSHFDSANQVPMGLLGAFIVHGPDDPEVDLDYVMVLNDGPLGYTLNGKGFPATEPIVLARGETVRIRYMNEGLQIHPMHLHGLVQTVIADDGYPLPQPYQADNVLVAPGDRIDVLVEATEPGPWAFHCHILSHAEGPDGMFGMVTAVIVE